MQTLIKTDFFVYIQRNISGEANSILLKERYVNFMKKLFRFCKSEGDHVVLFFVLNYTRTEFVFIQNLETECKTKKK